MKSEREKQYNFKILAMLLENPVITVCFIAQEIGLSEKTVRNHLKVINDFLKKNNLGIIEKKQRIGVWLNTTHETKIILENMISENTSELYLQDSDLRLNEVIRSIFLMKDNCRKTITGLASSLYLSIPTTLGIFKQAVEWFGENGVKVYLVRNKGICVEGEEIHYRRALKNFIFHKNDAAALQSQVQTLMPGLNSLKVRTILLQNEEQWRLSFSDESFKKIWIELCIAIYRMNTTKNKVEIDSEEEKIIVKCNEYSFTQTLFEKVEKEFAIEVEHNEVVALAKEILSANYLGRVIADSPAVEVLAYDLKLKEFVSKTISTISAIIDEDLSDDMDLFNSLLQHMGPAIFRLRYRNDKSETKIGYIKNDYKKVYRAAWATSYLFEEYFDVQVTEDELIYITLYVQVALERKTRPMHAILVSQTGLGYSQLLCEKIKKLIPQIKDIEIARFEGFDYKNCSHNDIILSPTPLPNKVENFILIDPTMSDESVMILSMQVRKIAEDIAKKEERLDNSCYTLLQPKLMYTSFEANSKEEVLKLLTSQLIENGCVSEGYYESVMKREQATTTAIGNGVAIPHGFSTCINESKVCICILKKPIQWDDDLVDVIFFLAFRAKSHQEMGIIQLFYKHLIKLTATDEKVDILRKIPSGAEMYKYLIS
ncbi:MAG: PTS sugar transporter subunit IIA [Clostridiaceae bacterium]